MSSTLENVFKKINTSGKVMIIDKMEIDIAIGDQAKWLDHLSKELADQLYIHLEKYQNSSTISGVIEKSVIGNFFDAFIYFLQYGVLPWWSDIKEQKYFFEQLDKLLQAGLVPEMKISLSSLLTDEKILQRIIWQIPDNLFFEIVYNLSPDIKHQIERIRIDIDKILSLAGLEEKKKIESIFKKVILTGIGTTEEYQLAKKIIDSIMESGSHSVMYPVFKKSVDEIKDKDLKKEIQNLLSQKTKSKKIPPENKQELIRDELVEAKTMDMEKEFWIKNRHREIEMKETEGIFIGNAGLVIVAGFLPMIFKKLSLINGDKITEINKAACLVNYLAYGENSFAEFELGLAKILCGIEMETPVDTNISLSDIEKVEAVELLLSVIEYWTILKDTSVDGLRESFLLREGKLSFTDNAWLLQVEQRSYDMLLQNIPWNITMIKLPWMNYLLKTEWIF